MSFQSFVIPITLTTVISATTSTRHYLTIPETTNAHMNPKLSKSCSLKTAPVLKSHWFV